MSQIEKVAVILAQNAAELQRMYGELTPNQFLFSSDFVPHMAAPRLSIAIPKKKSFHKPERNRLTEIRRHAIEKIKMIGRGNFGQVSLANYHNGSGTGTTVVAVKSLQASVDSAKAREMLLGEAEVMANLNHSNVVRLVGVVTSGEPTMIVIEYCEHGELGAYLTTHQLSTDQLYGFGMDCAAGMEYLTAQGIVHRDLAARNVLVDSKLRCKISDYGMSRVLDDKSFYQSHGAALPVRWTAPEALEQQVFSEKSDVWSFGILLYEIWSAGGLPYEGMNERRVWVEVVGGYRLASPKDCPVTIYTVMTSCWEEPNRRPAFITLLDTLQSISTTTMRPHPLSPYQYSGSNSAIASPAYPLSAQGSSIFSSDVLTKISVNQQGKRETVSDV